MFSHNPFDFSFLPSVLNDIINDNAQDMINLENREVHKQSFQPTLDLINRLEKRYDADGQYVYVIYALDIPFNEECLIFRDQPFIYSAQLEVSMEELNNILMLNDDLDFEEEPETDSEENIDMEEGWIDLDIEMDM